MSAANCPHARSFVNITLLEDEGEKVHICPDCRSARLDGIDEWIPARYGMADHLRSLVPLKRAAESRDHAAMHSRDDDPRWNRVG
jgi:hypothetical protein